MSITIEGSENQINIAYRETTGLYSVTLKGIPFTMSRRELEFMGDLINIMLRDNPPAPTKPRHFTRNGKPILKKDRMFSCPSCSHLQFTPIDICPKCGYQAL